MGQNVYLECYSGISGDMTVAALSGLMKDRTPLFCVLDHMPVEGFSYELKQVKKSGINAWDFLVKLDVEHENHDHDMEYLHGHGHTHDHHHGHEHHQDHAETAEHHHDPVQAEAMHAQEETGHEEHHHHHHEHRGLGDIFPIIDRCDMTDTAKELAKDIFRILAKAEAKAHNVPEDQVHFHEVGAVDSIVDIVAAAVCMDSLQVDGVIVPFLCEGKGTVRCQHGILPVPVPAVAEIAAVFGIRMKIMNIQGEFVTPTGAAAVAALRTSEKLPEYFVIEKTGMGAGKRNYEIPGILRAMLISLPDEQPDRICKLESNIDDCTGEELGYVMEKLFEAGARDVHYIPVYMKKNRPAWQLNIICDVKDIPKLEQIVFNQTTTIGIRRIMMERSVLQRREITVQTEYGKARVKVCELEGSSRFYPEYDSVTEICQKSGMGFPQVYMLLQHLAAGEQN